MSSTRPSLSRLFAIHQEIARKTYPSLDALAHLCDVTPRTIKRDLKVLREEFNAPLDYSREQNGYGYTEPFSLATPPLTEGELLALCLMMGMSQALQHTPFAPAVQRSLDKLRVMLPEPAQNTLLGAGPLISCLPEPSPPVRVETAIHFNALLRAIEEHRQVRLVYYTMSRDTVTTRVLDPYHLYYRRGMWYLYGFCHLRQEERDFALERMQQVDVLAERFPAPDLQAIQAQLARRFSVTRGDALVEVAIRFDADYARRIHERVWHSSQQITNHPDGGCTLTMTVEGVDSVARWVLGFGRHACPLSPPALVTLVRDEVKAMMRNLSPEKSVQSDKR